MPGVRFPPLENSQVQPTAYLIWDARRTTPGLLTFVQTVQQVTERRPAGTMCDSNGGS